MEHIVDYYEYLRLEYIAENYSFKDVKYDYESYELKPEMARPAPRRLFDEGWTPETIFGTIVDGFAYRAPDTATDEIQNLYDKAIFEEERAGGHNAHSAVADALLKVAEACGYKLMERKLGGE